MRPGILAGLAVALAALVVALFSPSGPPSGPSAEGAGAEGAGAGGPLLPGVSPDDVSSLVIADGTMRARFDRDESGRWSDADLADVADSTVAVLVAARRGRSLHADEDAAAYGLDALAVRVDVTTDDGTTTLRFGDVAPTGDAVYAHDDRDDPRTIFLAPRVVRARLERAIDRRVSR